MNTLPMIIIGIVLGVILIGILVVVTLMRKRKVTSKGTNYRACFILGISFLALGIIYGIVFLSSGTKAFLPLGIAFIGLGLSYIAIGLSNRDKWKKQ